MWVISHSASAGPSLNTSCDDVRLCDPILCSCSSNAPRAPVEMSLDWEGSVGLALRCVVGWRGVACIVVSVAVSGSDVVAVSGAVVVVVVVA